MSVQPLPATTQPAPGAVLLNGILTHGFDYDDTHPEAFVHSGSSRASSLHSLS